MAVRVEIWLVPHNKPTVITDRWLTFEDPYNPEFPIISVEGEDGVTKHFVHTKDDARSTYHPLLDGCAVSFTEAEIKPIDFKL